jgi:acyl-CoA synthetase (AMP-forming)/AMP-acid ligase II
MHCSTLTQLLADKAQANPDFLYLRFLKKGEVTSTYTYSQAWQLATRWASALIECGVRRNDAVFLALANTDDFVGAYYGTLLSGGVPVPVAPPGPGLGSTSYSVIAQRLKSMGAQVLVTPDDSGQASISKMHDLRVVTPRDIPTDPRSISPNNKPEELGLLQLTSGTSGKGKAVQLTHAALLAQISAVATALDLNENDSAVSWLPLYHDMGLIGYLLTPAWIAGCVSLLLVEDFILSPSLWIKALSDFQSSVTGGPASAYALCARFIKPSQAAQYDLRSVTKALIGSEMITPGVIEDFTERFRPAGFCASSMIPCYGLAENCLAVTMNPVDRGARYDRLDVPAYPGNALGSSLRTYVSVGVPLPNTEVVIANNKGERMSDRCVGEILVRSRSLMKGYYDEAEHSAEVLREGWLWTGDLGYLADGELYITGRKKDLIIVGGRNYYPSELEQLVCNMSGVRGKRVAVFSCEDARRSTEAVILLAETSFKQLVRREELRQSLRHTLISAGYPVNEVILLSPGTIPTTSNGKLMRVECKARYLAGEFCT